MELSHRRINFINLELHMQYLSVGPVPFFSGHRICGQKEKNFQPHPFKHIKCIQNVFLIISTLPTIIVSRSSIPERKFYKNEMTLTFNVYFND